MAGMQFGMDASGLGAAMGYLSGMTKAVNTPVYLDAVLEFTHSRLAFFFDKYLDSLAHQFPRQFQHVYEWPREYHAYAETVGNPAYRLWRHTLTGRGRNKVASFRFMASHVPSPVNPILVDGGVKENVHIFVWKAPAMEYNYNIVVEPKLAKFLAYVYSEGMVGEGRDSGFAGTTDPNGEAQAPVAFSRGPVEFKAGGDVTYLQFTKAFVGWWQSMASGEFDSMIKPTLEADLINHSAMNAAVRAGNKKAKTFTITGQATKYSADFAAAEQLAFMDLAEKKSNNYIEQARQRRLRIYGD